MPQESIIRTIVESKPNMTRGCANDGYERRGPAADNPRVPAAPLTSGGRRQPPPASVGTGGRAQVRRRRGAGTNQFPPLPGHDQWRLVRSARGHPDSPAAPDPSPYPRSARFSVVTSEQFSADMDTWPVGRSFGHRTLASGQRAGVAAFACMMPVRLRRSRKSIWLPGNPKPSARGLPGSSFRFVAAPQPICVQLSSPRPQPSQPP